MVRIHRLVDFDCRRTGLSPFLAEGYRRKARSVLTPPTEPNDSIKNSIHFWRCWDEVEKAALYNAVEFSNIDHYFESELRSTIKSEEKSEWVDLKISSKESNIIEGVQVKSEIAMKRDDGLSLEPLSELQAKLSPLAREWLSYSRILRGIWFDILPLSPFSGTLKLFSAH